MNPTGWTLDGDCGKTDDIRELDEAADRDKIFYKSRWIKEKSTVHTGDGNTKNVVIEQQLIVSYSIKYRDYLRSIRNDQILSALQEMDFVKHEGKGYQPVYTRTELTDALHDAFGFCTSKQIVPIFSRNI